MILKTIAAAMLLPILAFSASSPVLQDNTTGAVTSPAGGKLPAFRASVGLAIGANVQAYDADLATWATVTPSANGQSLVSAANYAAMKTLLGLTIGTDIQAYDADLTTLGAGGAGARSFLGLVIGTDVLAPNGNGASLTGIPLTTGVTGTLPVANGGTGQATLTSLPLVTPIITSASTSTAPTITSLLAASMTASSTGTNGLLIPFGVSLGDSNAGQLQFHYEGSTNAANFVGLGLYAHSPGVPFRVYQDRIELGVSGSLGGKITLQGATSGAANIIVPATAGTPDLTLPTTTGTLAIVADITGGSRAASFTTLAASDLITETRSGLGSTTPAYGANTSVAALLTNSTAATVGTTVQISPALRFHGSAWKSNATAAAQDHEWQAFVLPATGSASTTSKWKLQSSNNGAAFLDNFTLTDDGSLSLLDASGNVSLGYSTAGSGKLTIRGQGTNAQNVVITPRDSSYNNVLPATSGVSASIIAATNLDGLVLGPNVEITGTLQLGGIDLILGREGAAILQLGVDAAGVTNQTLKAPDRITSDGVGGNLTIAGGRNRGASAGGSIIFQTAPATTAGNAGTLATALTIDSSQTSTFTGAIAVGSGGTAMSLVKHGSDTLSGGTTGAVSATWITTGTRFICTGQGTTASGHLAVTIVNGTSYQIDSSNASDARAVTWIAVKP